jgi:ABC-type transporter Mla MlaB component
MAKDRHRIFEIYSTRDEAGWEIMPKTNKVGNDLVALGKCSFHQLIVSQLAGITQVRYKEADVSTQEMIAQVQDDFAQLADALSGDSRVLIDFTGVQTFDPTGINALIALNRKLQVRGSRMVLCGLESNVRATFFAAP